MSLPRRPMVASMFERLAEAAATHPDRIALAMACGRDPCGRTAFSHVSFHQLWSRACRYGHGLRELGVGKQDRVVILVPPGNDGVALAYAVMALGATAVSVDPGMTPHTMANCIAEAEASVMIGIDRAHLLLLRYPWSLRRVRLFVGAGRLSLPRTVPLSSLLHDNPQPLFQEPVDADSLHAIVFTSGSTGQPIGVELTHGNFSALLDGVERILPAGQAITDLVTYGLFLLISTARGRTAVLPDMDIARPAACDPARIVEAIDIYRPSGGFGSPALWERVVKHCSANGIVLSSMETVVSAGAPVPIRLVAALAKILPNGRVYTPYGATEALPMACIDSSELLADAREQTAVGGGTCVGRPVEGVQVRIIRTCEEPLATWKLVEPLQIGEVGEICVAGENVTARYLKRPQEMALSKVADPSIASGFWHRTGDLGYFDDKGRLWYCGRKKHRFQLGDVEIRPVQLEGIFLALPQVFRCAAVRVQRGNEPRLALVIEPVAGHHSKRELKALKSAVVERASNAGFDIHENDVLVHRKPFPVDRRHNSKIHFEALTVWAQRRVDGLASRVPSFRRRAAASGWG